MSRQQSAGQSAGEPFCRLDVAFTNNHPDHRVRLHVPLHRPATHSHAEGQFAVVARGLHSEGRHGEVPLPTFLTVTGDGVTMTSLRRRDEEWLELRVVATTDQPTTVRCGRSGGAAPATLGDHQYTTFTVTLVAVNLLRRRDRLSPVPT